MFVSLWAHLMMAHEVRNDHDKTENKKPEIKGVTKEISHFDQFKGFVFNGRIFPPPQSQPWSLTRIDVFFFHWVVKIISKLFVVFVLLLSHWMKDKTVFYLIVNNCLFVNDAEIRKLQLFCQNRYNVYCLKLQRNRETNLRELIYFQNQGKKDAYSMRDFTIILRYW